MIKRFFLFCFSFFLISPCYAWVWEDLWFRADEQGIKLLSKNKPAEAAKRFDDPEWQGVAYYRAGRYERALERFSRDNSPLSLYDRGNVLAQLGEYKAAIVAYDEALQLQADFPDAKFNRDLMKKLLSQQKSQKKQQKKQQKNSKQSQRTENKKQSTSDQNKQKDQQSSKAAMTSQQKEQQQAIQHYLRSVPDEPGGLLRQKFLRDHLRRRREKKGEIHV